MFGDEEDKLNKRRMFNELCHTNYYSPQCLLWQVFEAAQSSSVRGCTAVVHSAEKGLLSKEGETPLLYRPVWSPSNTAVHLVCQVRIKNTKRSPNFSIPCTSLKFGQIIGLHLNYIFDTGPVTGSLSGRVGQKVRVTPTTSTCICTCMTCTSTSTCTRKSTMKTAVPPF